MRHEGLLVALGDRVEAYEIGETVHVRHIESQSLLPGHLGDKQKGKLRVVGVAKVGKVTTKSPRAFSVQIVPHAIGQSVLHGDAVVLHFRHGPL